MPPTLYRNRIIKLFRKRKYKNGLLYERLNRNNLTLALEKVMQELRVPLGFALDKCGLLRLEKAKHMHRGLPCQQSFAQILHKKSRIAREQKLNAQCKCRESTREIRWNRAMQEVGEIFATPRLMIDDHIPYSIRRRFNERVRQKGQIFPRSRRNNKPARPCVARCQ